MSVLETIKARYGFITDDEVEELKQIDRFRQVLVRCGCGRFTCAVQDVDHFVGIIERSKEDYIRDVRLLDDDTRMN